MDDVSTIPDGFVRELQKLWAQKHEELTGIKMNHAIISDDDMEAFWHSKYIR
jgi:hypothetical protein